MTRRVGAKGQVVIPRELREQAGLHPGSKVDFALEGKRIVLAVKSDPAQLGGRFKKSGMARRLLDDRGREPR